MKRYISLLLAAVLAMLFPFAVSSAGELPYIIDDAALLSTEEQLLLEEMAAGLQNNYGYDVVILTVDFTDGSTIQNFADNFYDTSGYSDNGVLLVLSMSAREWYISTCGDVIFALTDYGISQLGEAMLPYLSEGLYFDAFSVYLRSLPEYFDAFLRGAPLDGYADYSGDYYHGDQEEILYYDSSDAPNYFLSVIIGLIAAAITVLIMRSTMSNKKPQRSAASYLKSGSYRLRTHQDLFLYSNISKVRRQENSSSHSGGGSSVHRSAGGRRHGGGGGRF